MENLLALIEFVQFKNLVITTFNVDRKDIGDVFDFMFPASVPVSDIVGVYDGRVPVSVNGGTGMNHIERMAVNLELEEDKLVRFKMKAYKLCCKYVESECEFELNLPHRIRVELSGLMENYDEWIKCDDEFQELELVKLFDHCLDEIVSLLRGSKSRLKY